MSKLKINEQTEMKNEVQEAAPAETTKQEYTTGVFANYETARESFAVAKSLATSDLIPKEFKNNPANCLIALDIAQRLNMPPMMVMQQLYIVHGKPSWSGQAAIAIINNSRRYKAPLKFKLEGSGQTLSCYAYTTDLEGNEIRGAKVTMAMVKAEGWDKSKGGMTSKWLTMPEQMMMYRSATFFARTNCPDLLMGMQTYDEVEDITEIKEAAHDPFKEADNA